MLEALDPPPDKELSRLTKDEWREYTKTVWQIPNTSDPDHPAVFPKEIPHRLVKLFTFVGETVLDPFAGIGTTVQASLDLDRRAIGIDQNCDYIRVAQQRLGLRASFGDAELRVGDSRNLSWLKAGAVDLVVTSPPYWDKAAYGDDAANLGNRRGYLEFVESLRPVFAECLRVLKPGRKLCIVTANVNQHTDEGLLSFPLSADLTLMLRDLGYVMINEIIWNKDGTGGKWGSWGKQRPIFGSYPYPPNFLFKTVHEYILVFATPKTVKVRGPKVKLLNSLLEHGRNGLGQTAQTIESALSQTIELEES